MFFVFTSTGIDEEKEIGFSSVFSILWKNSKMETQYNFILGKNKNKIIIILGLDIMTTKVNNFFYEKVVSTWSIIKIFVFSL